MLVWENILLAFHSLRANKMRSLLTMLGIIIGIASVIAIMTLGDSISSSVTDSMASMGANNITMGVRHKSSRHGDDGQRHDLFPFGPRMAQPDGGGLYHGMRCFTTFLPAMTRRSK